MPTALKLIIFLVVLVLSAAPITAGAEPTELSVCMDKVDLGALKEQQWVACEAEELARQDRRLNDEYKRLQSQAAKNGVVPARALAAAERQWLSYREMWCAFDVIEGGAPGPDFNKVACMVELTKSQADLLRNEVH